MTPVREDIRRAPLRIGVLARLAKQYAKFGVVGLSATATHVGVFSGLIEFVGAPPLAANLFAFSIAVVVSFLGHFCWTFSEAARARGGAGHAAFMRFLAVALLGLGLNSATVYAVTEVLALHYLYAVTLMVTAVPLVVFVLSKLWAFR